MVYGGIVVARSAAPKMAEIYGAARDVVDGEWPAVGLVAAAEMWRAVASIARLWRRQGGLRGGWSRGTEDVMLPMGSPARRAESRGGAVGSAEERWGWRAFGTGEARSMLLRALSGALGSLVGGSVLPVARRDECRARIARVAADTAEGRWLWAAGGRAVLKALRGWAMAGGPAQLRAQAVAAARAEEVTAVRERRERERDRRRAYVVHRKVVWVGGVRRVVRVVPEALAALRARRLRVRARVRELRRDLREHGLVAGVRPPRVPSPPLPEPTAEELAARARCEAEAVARLEARRVAREERARRLRETPLPTYGGPGGRMGVRQVQAAFHSRPAEGQVRRRQSAVMERRLRAAWQRTVAIREAKRLRGEAPLSGRVVRRVVAKVIGDYERVVRARRKRSARTLLWRG